jgi:hypothetical protein
MSNLIEWGFTNTPTKFVTKADKFEATVATMRNLLNAHPDQEITIYNHAANQSIPNDVSSSDSDSNASDTPTVPKRAKKAKPMEEAVELQPVSAILDDAGSQSDVL